MPRWLSSACEKVIRTTTTSCIDSLEASGGASEPATNLKVPTLIAASTVTSPTRLNQAVAQPQPRPPRIDAQWYRPPAVGKAEASWPIVAETTSANRETSGQTRPIAEPPALQSPRWNEVTP